jgi:N-acetylneuraminate lyase
MIDKLVERLIADGLEGLFVTGSTGQGPLLTESERMSVAERTLKAASKSVPVMVHVGAITTNESIRLAKHAEKHGAVAVSSVPPYYFPASPAVTFEHYKRIGEATGLPFFPYHFSALIGKPLDPKEYVERVLEIPTARGMKFTDLNMYALGLMVNHAGGRLAIFSGADELVLQGAISGACGAIGSTYNYWGGAVKRVRAAFASGELQRPAEFSSRLQWAIEARKNDSWSFMRAAVRIRHGIDISMPRAPVGTKDRPWSDDEVRAVLDLVIADD